MIITKFCIVKNLYDKDGHDMGYPLEFYFVVRDEIGTGLFEQAKDFFEDFKKNEDTHIKTIHERAEYELRIVDYHGELELK